MAAPDPYADLPPERRPFPVGRYKWEEIVRHPAERDARGIVVGSPTLSVLYAAATFADAHTGELWPSRRTVAAALAVSEDTVTRAYSDALGVGLLVRLDARRGPGRTTRWALALPPIRPH